MRLGAIVTGLKYLNLDRHNVAYIGWTGHNNLGDEAMSFVSKEILFSYCRFLQYKMTFAGRCLHSLVPRPYSGILLGSGTLIGTNLEGECAIRIQDAIRRGFPVHVLGAGVRNPEYWGSEAEDALRDWIPLLQKCVSVGVRGPLSQRLLDNAGVEAQVVGDPAVVLHRKCNTQVRDIPVLGINFGTALNEIWGHDESALCKKLAAVAREFAQRGWQIRVFPVWARDKRWCFRLARESGHPRVAVVVPDYSDPHTYLGLMEEVTVFVGMKLHSVVLAHCRGVPSVMLEYRPKCRDYMVSVGESQRTVRTDSVSVPDLVDQVQALADERDVHSRVIEDRVAKLARTVRKRAGCIMNSIRGENS